MTSLLSWLRAAERPLAGEGAGAPGKSGGRRVAERLVAGRMPAVRFYNPG
jgi:hypothetical protein